MKTVNICALILLLRTVCGKPIVPQKIAILGGGAASCTAALALTSQPGWKERYDITIYQLGWRLGGKAASARNSNYGQRIEVVAGHFFPGIYHNFKRLLRSVYKELDRPEGVPLRTFDDAFKLTSYITNKRLNASTDNPDHDRRCFSWKYLLEKLVKSTFSMADQMGIETGELDFDHLLDNPDLLQRKVNSIQEKIQNISANEKNSTRIELLSIVDVCVTSIKGILVDNLIENGFNSINHLDLREWLAKHGANAKTLKSGFVKIHYDVNISYKNGDIEKPSVEAGNVVKMSLHIYFCYDDAPFFKQEGGDGDVIFSPIYEVLKKRGVSFKFFHKVEELNLNINNPKLVEQIRVTKQVELMNEEYDPLINIKGLPSWPNEPKYEEIVQEQANLLKANDIDLESFWTRWPSVYEEHFKQPLPEIILKRGHDFDIIISGIPVTSLSYLCPELLEASENLRNAKEHIETTASMQLQLWTDEPRENLMLDSYTELIDPNREDIDYTIGYYENNIKFEDWKPLGMNPKGCQFFTFFANIEELPPSNNTEFPHECKEKSKKLLKSRIENSFENSMPKAYKDGQFKWEILTDPENRTGEERFDAQYFLVNINPSDRYVQYLTNTSQHRITTDGAGFDNIYFTGDWIQNGFICCFEAAVTAGLLTSKAISGYPREIFWEDYIDLPSPK